MSEKKHTHIKNINMSDFKVYPPTPGWNTSSGVPPPPPPSEDVPKSLDVEEEIGGKIERR